MEAKSNEIPELLRDIYPFSLLEDQDYGDALQFCQFTELPPGTRILSNTDHADRMYIILEGEVKTKGNRDKSLLQIHRLRRGDHFGDAAIAGKGPYRISAECVNQVSLLVLTHKNIVGLMKIFPYLREAFALMELTLKTSQENDFPWLVADEKIFLACRRHKIIPATRLFFINLVGIIGFILLLFASFASKEFSTFLIVLAFLVLLGDILVSVWSTAEWANDQFIVTSERVAAQRKMYGLFDSRQESPIGAILSTAFDTSLIGRLVGYGTVSLKSYTGEIHFKSLPYPESIFNYLEYLRGRSAEEKRLEEKARIQKNLEGRLNDPSFKEQVNRLPTDLARSVTSVYQSGSLLDWLARLFQLRQEQGASIIYRTHWWIMVRKTFIPFILIIVLLIGFISKILGLFPAISESTFYLGVLFLTFVSAMWWLYQYIDWYNDQYILTKDQLIDVSRKPLGYEDRRSAPVKNIQTVEYKRKGIIGLLLNYGTVRIQIGNEELTFDNVYDPSQIQGEVYLQLKRYQEEQQRLEGQRMAEWITTYDRIKNGENPQSQKDG